MTAAGRRAIRATVRGAVQAVGFRDATVAAARALGLLGWVRHPPAREDDGATVLVHAEGAPEALDELAAFLREGPPGARVEGVEVTTVRAEGHEQFAIRGVVAGRFVVKEHQARARHWDLRLEVDGAMRSWAVPKGPSLDPAAKRMAIEAPDHPLDGDAEGPLGDGHAIVWDQGGYEQGGRVPWPEALDRGHAVFVLHGEKLRGGFALQRTRRDRSGRQQWLLIKRRDDDARPGSDVVAERPESVLSGRTLDELIG